MAAGRIKLQYLFCSLMFAKIRLWLLNDVRASVCVCVCVCECVRLFTKVLYRNVLVEQCTYAYKSVIQRCGC